MECTKLDPPRQQTIPEPEIIDKRGVGQQLSDFRVISELGRGAYGVIKKVVSYIDHKEYVMKKITMAYTNPNKQQAALKEADILKKVYHTHIIKYYTSFIENSYLYIIMEYAEGGDLSKLIKSFRAAGQKFEEKRIWLFAKELCQALHYLHENNILHRDIKASNVFLTKDLHVKLGDLGVSKIVNNALPLQGTKIGTPLYLAPEMVQELPYNFKVDSWALGCVLYTLVALEAPFKGDNLISLGHNIVYNEPKPLPEGYSSMLMSLIMTLLNKDPGTRPTIAEVWQYFPEAFRAPENIVKLRESREKSMPPIPAGSKTASMGNTMTSMRLPTNKVLIEKFDAIRNVSPSPLKPREGRAPVVEAKDQSVFEIKSANNPNANNQNNNNSRVSSISPQKMISTRKEIFEKINNKRKEPEESVVAKALKQSQPSVEEKPRHNTRQNTRQNTNESILDELRRELSPLKTAEDKKKQSDIIENMRKEIGVGSGSKNNSPNTSPRMPIQVYYKETNNENSNKRRESARQLLSKRGSDVGPIKLEELNISQPVHPMQPQQQPQQQPKEEPEKEKEKVNEAQPRPATVETVILPEDKKDTSSLEGEEEAAPSQRSYRKIMNLKEEYSGWMARAIKLEKHKSKPVQMPVVPTKMSIMTPLLKQISAKVKRNYLVSANISFNSEKPIVFSSQNVVPTTETPNLKNQSFNIGPSREESKEILKDRKKNQAEKLEKQKVNRSYDLEIRPVSAQMLINHSVRISPSRMVLESDMKIQESKLQPVKKNPLDVSFKTLLSPTGNKNDGGETPFVIKREHRYVSADRFGDVNRSHRKNVPVNESGNCRPDSRGQQDLRALRGPNVAKSTNLMAISNGFNFRRTQANSQYNSIDYDENSSFPTELKTRDLAAKNSFEVDKDRQLNSRGQSLIKYTKTASNGFGVDALNFGQNQNNRSKLFTPDRKRLTVDDLK